MSTSSDEKRRIKLLRRQAYGYAMLGQSTPPVGRAVPRQDPREQDPAASTSLIETAAGLFMVIRRHTDAPSAQTVKVIDEWLMDYGDWLASSSLEDLIWPEPMQLGQAAPSEGEEPAEPIATRGTGRPALGIILAVGISLLGAALLGLLAFSAWKSLLMIGLGL